MFYNGQTCLLVMPTYYCVTKTKTEKFLEKSAWNHMEKSATGSITDPCFIVVEDTYTL